MGWTWPRYALSTLLGRASCDESASHKGRSKRFEYCILHDTQVKPYESLMFPIHNTNEESFSAGRTLV